MTAGERLALIVGLAIVVIACISIARADSGHHGHGHTANHDWYEKLKRPGTTSSCCNGSQILPGGELIEGDCRPTRAWQEPDGSWTAMLDGKPVHVPPRVVLKDLAPDGRSHICANKSGMIFCFIGGSPKS